MKLHSKTVNEIITLLSYNQEELAQSIVDVYTPTVHSKGKYIMYKYNNKPKPMLCVHLDTINTHYNKLGVVPNIDLEYDSGLDLLGVASKSKLDCLGADDRAGVWIALKVLKWMYDTQNYKYDIGFFYDEEIGCVGSSQYSKDFDSDNTTCYIGLDRRSTNGGMEVATYGYDNDELLARFNALGYKTVTGSITDAAALAGSVSCCNISVGYENEHTTQEVLHIQCMYQAYLDIVEMDWDDKPYEVMELAHYDGYAYNDYTSDTYIAELEYENEILKDVLESMGVSVEDVLQEGLPAYMGRY